MDRFEEFLAGGHLIDEHFRTAPLGGEPPGGAGAPRRLVRRVLRRPRPRRPALRPVLHRFAAHLQQLDMESQRQAHVASGRQMPSSGYATGPIVWGEPGHQRPARLLPAAASGNTASYRADFIAPLESSQHPLGDHHEQLLLANLLRADRGPDGGARTEEEVRAELVASRSSPPEEPSSSLRAAQGLRRGTGLRTHDSASSASTPRARSASLLAFYEHKHLRPGCDLGCQQLRPMGRRAR